MSAEHLALIRWRDAQVRHQVYGPLWDSDHAAAIDDRSALLGHVAALEADLARCDATIEELRRVIRLHNGLLAEIREAGSELARRTAPEAS